ncbi:MAG TPA: HAMP domain-containing sensor histidine kinase [Solirubrobacterales bacterium]|jgi:two-component system OmpR family sensor kinase|nr:HAMP domain-containing sensor histidine kinase [Solirubrobacterales bacterium]
MRRFGLTNLGSRITVISVVISVGTLAVVYIYVFGIGPTPHSVSQVKGQMVAGALIALALTLVLGLYFAQLAASHIARLQDAARKVADGNFETQIPISSAGQLGQLARTFNEMQSRLAELDSARKQFIANASHELRTPIFSLGGFVELLEEEDPSPEERAEFVRTMRQQIERLTKLTTDLLDLSQLDAGAVALRDASVDLGSLARDVAREFGPRADRRGSRLELRTPDRPAIARADPDRVRQILRILLDNALTHTPEGTKVTVTTYSENHRAELTVSDEGSGIPKRVQGRIFERFYTADSAGGSGLGLAIARELAQRMGGRIAITSSKRFTAFTLDLPPAREPAELPPPASAAAPSEAGA